METKEEEKFFFRIRKIRQNKTQNFFRFKHLVFSYHARLSVCMSVCEMLQLFPFCQKQKNCQAAISAKYREKLDDYVLGLIVKYKFSRVQKKKKEKNVFLREFPKKLVCLISSKIYQIKICFYFMYLPVTEVIFNLNILFRKKN